MSTLTRGTRVRVINQSHFHGKLGQIIRRARNPAFIYVRLDGGNPKGQPFIDGDLVPLTASISRILYPNQPHGNRAAAVVVGGYREDFVGNRPITLPGGDDGGDAGGDDDEVITTQGIGVDIIGSTFVIQ